MLVVDVSAIVPQVFQDETQQGIPELIRAIAAQGSVTPWLFWFELRNVLVHAERRGRISVHDSAEFIGDIDRLPISLDADPHSDTVLLLARSHSLTLYDASYLELAFRLKLSLATRDKALIAAALKVGVPLFEPIIPH